MAAVGANEVIGENQWFFTHPSTATNGAGARLVPQFYVDRDTRIKRAYWMPLDQSQATVGSASASASYRRLSIFNGGSAGTVTATASRIASLNLTASLASFGSRAFAVDTTVTAASGSIIYFSQETISTYSNDATILAAGMVHVVYETF